MKKLAFVLINMAALNLMACGGGDSSEPPAPPTNTNPVANAGPDQAISEGATVQLAGVGSDAEGAVTLAWTQVSGPTVTLSSTTTAAPAFTAPQVTASTTIVLRLTATDSANASANDTITITINDTSGNTPPTANAGADQIVGEGAAVQLVGSGSDAQGAVTYAWTQVSGPTVALSNAAINSPSFTAPQVSSATSVVLSLTVTDSSSATASDTITITVNDTSTPPPPGGGAYNRRVHTMRFDFDNNGTFEGVETYIYNPDGSHQSSTYVYTDDGTPDVDLQSFSLGFGGDENENTTLLYDAQGRVERWTLQSASERTELNFNWHPSGVLNTAMFDTFNGSGALEVRANFITGYTSGRLTSWQMTTPQASITLSLALNYSGAGVVQSDVKTTTPGNSQVQRDFSWDASGAIDYIHEHSLTGSFDATTDFIYLGGRIVEQIHVLPGQLYSWNYEYYANGLPHYHRVDLGDNGSIQAVIDIEWETGTCRDVIVWAPEAEPSPFKRLNDPRVHSFGDGHFEFPLCGSVP